MLKTAMVDSMAYAPAPKSGAGVNGGALNSAGDGSVIQTKTFINVPTSGNGALEGAFQDKLEPKDIGIAPAGGSPKPPCGLETAMESHLGGYSDAYKGNMDYKDRMDYKGNMDYKNHMNYENHMDYKNQMDYKNHMDYEGNMDYKDQMGHKGRMGRKGHGGYKGY